MLPLNPFKPFMLRNRRDFNWPAYSLAPWTETNKLDGHVYKEFS